MRLRTINGVLPLPVIAVATLAAGCASTEVASYQRDLTRAAASIQEAERAGAYEHGAVELDQARNRYSEAEDAARAGDEERAARLASEAELDAKLAMAMADNQEMQAAAQEMRNSIQTLRDELERSDRRRDL
jgi:hypothetical protein